MSGSIVGRSRGKQGLGVSAKVASKRPLHHIFTAVPPRYDLINSLITWGLDRRWRLKAARECLSIHPQRVLDLGCGTGDLAIGIARLVDAAVELVGIDYSLPMLERATGKAKDLADNKPAFVYGDAASLPFPDGYFDCIGISFAFRNLTYKNPMAPDYLAEVLRVLRPGGRFIIVESSQPKARLVRNLFHIYLRWCVYRLGYLLSGNRGAYSYLVESAARFYTADELKELLIKVGFQKVSFQPLFLGAAGICIAVK
jgi:demethylmenaquinone methyltransferase/2-methoxy-6-polyprenyl-1,4-benzoquinol methylase